MASMVDFSAAKTKHMAWKGKLRDFLNGKGGGLNEIQAASPKHCDLGIWLYADGLKDYGSVMEMKQLEMTHARLHSTIGKVISAKNSGDMAAAKYEFNKVGGISTQIINLLDKIEAKLKSAA